MIILPRRYSRSKPIVMKARCAGTFQSIEVIRPDGEVRQRLEPFSNHITDFGLNYMADNNDWLQACYVGSGSAEPVDGDTTLETYVAHTSSTISNTNGAQASAPYYAWRTKIYDFPPASGAVNLSEIAVGPINLAGDYAFTRELIRDGLGNPTTISLLEGEVLRVTYQFRYYPPLTDSSGEEDVSGVPYTFTGRASQVTSNSGGSGWSISFTHGERQLAQASTISLRVYDGSIGAITSQPSGSLATNASVSNASYSAGSFARSAEYSWSLTQGNLASGISAIFLKFGIGSYQVGVSPALAKDNEKVMTLGFSISWGRYEE